MKFICNQQVLARALNTVSKAVSSRTTIPILKGILIEAKENKITLSASDLDISIKKEIKADVLEEGSVVVVSKLFGDIIRKLPNEDITFNSFNEGSLLINTSRSEFTVVTMPIEEFPSIGESGNENTTVSLSANMFREMIRKTSFAAAIDEAKGILVGILTELSEDSIDMVTLDGFRLAHERKPMINSGKSSFIIEAKIMNELSKISSDEIEADVVRISFGENRALVQVGSTEITIRVLEGEFIKYKEVIPKDSNTCVIIDRALLLESIERASLLAKDGNNNLIKMTIEDDLLTIKSRSEEGNVKEEITIDKTGDNLEIGFNSKYVMDAIKVIEDEEIKMNFKSGITPCVITPVEGDEYEYLVLPVRIPHM